MHHQPRRRQHGTDRENRGRIASCKESAAEQSAGKRAEKLRARAGGGGGIVVGGKLLSGPNRIAGEWGHNPLPWPRQDELPGHQ